MAADRPARSRRANAHGAACLRPLGQSSSRHGHGNRGRITLVAALALPLFFTACNDESDTPRESAVVSAPAATLAFEHLARVHVAAYEGARGPRGSSLAVEARFAAFAGLDLEEAAIRASVSPLWSELLSPGECIALPRSPRGEPRELDVGAERELLLLDAGDLRVQLGDLEQLLPIVLVPDLVPWVSGVEYVWTSTTTREGLAGPSRANDEPLPVRIEASGNDADLPSFSLETMLPSPIELAADEGATIVDTLSFSWTRGERDEAFLLEFSNTRAEAGAPTVACLVEDEGRAVISRATLASAGLRIDGPVEVVARRQRIERVSVGAFDAIEVVTEAVDALTLEDR